MVSEINRLALPIAEDFHSLQGEGRWAGTPMHFIRLAGCSVGQPPAVVLKQDDATLIPILKTTEPAWRCHTYDGRAFWCDTDFKLRKWVSFDDLIRDTWEYHICITGGEPLIHEDKLHDFIDQAFGEQIQVHVETSGTIEVSFDPHAGVWVSVSPKQGYLTEMIESCDEVKLLVDEHFDIDLVPHEIRNHANVYVQPINDELMVSKPNFERCMKILRAMPHWHLSVQLHKLLGLR